METKFVITDLPHQPINGHKFSLKKLKKIIAVTELSHCGFNTAGAKVYDINEVAKAVDTFSKLETEDDETLKGYRIAKLKEDIKKSKLEQDRLNQDKELKQVELDERKRQSIPAEEVLQFITMRAAVLKQILRLILQTRMPVEITGLEIPKARNVADEYFNLYMDIELETEKMFKDRYGTGDVELPYRLIQMLDKIKDLSKPLQEVV